jgi:hypothetical protein
MRINMFNHLMGWNHVETQTISATDVITILQADHKHDWDAELAKKGRNEHSRILNSLNEQINPTFLNQAERSTKIDIQQGQMLHRGRTLETSVDEGLTLRVAPDAIIAHDHQLSCIEIKSNFHPYHLLQLLYGCIVANETYAGHNGGVIQGILYLYNRQESVRTLEDGGKPFWNDALRIAGLAHEIKLGKSSHPLKTYDLPVQDHRERAVINRREMEQRWDIVSSGLRELLH